MPMTTKEGRPYQRNCERVDRLKLEAATIGLTTWYANEDQYAEDTSRFGGSPTLKSTLYASLFDS